MESSSWQDCREKLNTFLMYRALSIPAPPQEEKLSALMTTCVTLETFACVHTTLQLVGSEVLLQACQSRNSQVCVQFMCSRQEDESCVGSEVMADIVCVLT